MCNICGISKIWNKIRLTQLFGEKSNSYFAILCKNWMHESKKS